MHRILLIFWAVLGASAAAAFAPAQPSASFDVLIRNGRVMDGTGNPWVGADIGIRGDRIAAVGRLTGAAATTTIDAAGRLVTPGFIDVHTHAGESLTREALRQAQPILAQGVTTLVLNPDGGGPVDLAAQRAALEQGGVGPNVALLIGHASVRRAVIGGAAREPAAGELDRMRALVRQAMEQGAFGLSSGLFYTPGSFAKTEEVIELARIAAEFGGVYTSHVRDEGNYSIGIVAAVEEVIRIAEEGGLIGIVTHMKALGPDSWGLSMAMTTRIEQARARGVQVFADQYPYEASSTGLGAALAPGGVKPTLEIVAENMRRRGGAAAIQIAFHKANRSLEGKTLETIAKDRGVTPVQAALDILAAGGASIVSYNMSEADIEHIMRKPYTMASSDGALSAMGEGVPHPRNYGAFARKLARYVRERGVIDLETAIRSMTSLPATVFGMKDRGVIRDGAFADLAIFDLARVRDRATYTDPHQLAEGMDYVLVNGIVTVSEGRFTLALPGKVLRKVAGFVATAPQVEPEWQSLFDGRTLDNWQPTKFGGEGAVRVEGGRIVLEMGVADLTGITWAGPALPKTSYELALQATRLDGNDFFAGITFPVADSFCSLILGGWGGTVVGLSSIDGLDASENETSQSVAFDDRRWYDVRIRVTPAKIQAWLDEKPIIDQAITGKTIDTRAEVELSQPLGVAAWRTKSAVRNIRVRRLPPLQFDLGKILESFVRAPGDVLR
jgi:N-acyl-D-amino-acid deacylase